MTRFALLAAAAPVQAAETSNSIKWNGFSLNGVSLQGVNFNGRTFNSLRLNGEARGDSPAGLVLHGISLGGGQGLAMTAD